MVTDDGCGDVPRVVRADCRVTLFADDLVCILNALAQVSVEGRVRWRDGGERRRGGKAGGGGFVVAGRRDPPAYAFGATPLPRRRDVSEFAEF